MKNQLIFFFFRFSAHCVRRRLNGNSASEDCEMLITNKHKPDCMRRAAVTACRINSAIMCSNFIARRQKIRSDEYAANVFLDFSSSSIFFLYLFSFSCVTFSSSHSLRWCVYWVRHHSYAFCEMRESQFNFRDFCLAEWQSVGGRQRFLLMILCVCVHIHDTNK